MGRFLIFVSLAVALYLSFVLIIYLFLRSLLYHPSRGDADPANYDVPEMTRVEIETSDGLKLEAWFKNAKQEKKIILYLHGNGGHLGYRGSKIRQYLDAGFGVLLLGYRGYGNNLGTPTENNLYTDARAALNFLLGKNIPLSNLVIYGESLGTVVAVELSRNLRIHALILEAPYSSILDLAAHHYFYLPTRLLLKDKYDSVNKIKDITSPVYFIHGKQDRIIPIKYSKKLFDAAPEPKDFLLITSGGHNNLYDFGVSQNVIKFIDQYK